MSETILACQKLTKTYHDGTSSISVLKEIDFSISQGDKIAIVGPSGSGKSTLLHLLGGLDKPSAGQVSIKGLYWHKQNERQRCQLRNQYLGFVYQFHHLLPEFSALENVAMPILLLGKTVEEAHERASDLLGRAGLGQRLSHKPAQLSGGERQRVAIARALVNQPQCILADEPTGNLDQTTAIKVFDLMINLNHQLNTALVIVTHDKQLAERMDKTFSIQEGRIC